MGRKSIVLGLLVAALVACGRVDPQSDANTAGSDRDEVPARLKMICHKDGSTELVNSEVRAQADGVHIQVDNRADEFVSLNGVGLDFSQGTTEQVARVAPGEVKIACWPGSMHSEQEPKRLTVQVHDPNQYWVPAELECPRDELIVSSTGDFAADSKGTSGDPEEIARSEVEGIEDTDSVQSVGYPDAEYRQVAVERNEETIALLSFSPAPKGGWLLGGYSACDSAGIRG